MKKSKGISDPPRFEVIANYPNSPFAEGSTIELQSTGEGWEYSWYGHDGKYSEHLNFFEEFPHIFKRI